MRKIIILLAATLMSGAALAQNAYDAANFAGSDLNGTARYVGMGGALSALGGEITTMGTNPAATGLFRKSEVAFTVSSIFTDEKGQLSHDATRASIDQLGVILSLDQENQSSRGLQYINFGVNYTKKRNHLGNFVTDINHLSGMFSQTFQMADLANYAYDADSWGMLADMAAPAYDDAGNLSKDGVIVDYYDNQTGDFLGYDGVAAQSALYKSATFGSTSQADFNLSFNISNQFFWGFSFGVYDVNYTRESYYYEMGVDGGYYDLSNWYETSGEGYDLKFGFLCRPVENSPFRFGLTVHTPTWYRMEDVNGATLYYKDTHVDTQSTDPYEYDYRTPWKFGASLGYTVDNYLAIGAEYELQDFSTCHYESRDMDNDLYFATMNQNIEDFLQVQHTLKLGLEFKPADNFAVRCGYNYVSSPIKESSYNNFAYDSPFTETAFTNWKGLNRYTLGVGYRFQGGYFDLAYQYQKQKGDFYAFDEIDLKPTEISNNRSQVMATIGFRW